MYRQSRFFELASGNLMAMPEIDLSGDNASLFSADIFSVQLPLVHDEMPEFGGCACCDCGDAALKNMLKLDDGVFAAEGSNDTLYMDSVAGNSSTTAILTVGGVVKGTRETATDADWYQVDLVQGTTYTFYMLRDGTTNEHEDPLMKLIGTNGVTVIQENDDIELGEGSNRNSKISYTATETGTFYISAEGWSTTTGDYALYANIGSARHEASLDTFADWLTHGFTSGTQWGTTNITYDVSTLPAEAQALAIRAFGAWAEVSGLTFTAAAPGTANITFQDVDPDGPDADGDIDSGAFARTPSTNGIITSSTIHVDANWSTNGDGSNNYDLNSYRYQTYLHEIGHALGLGHGGAYNSSATFGVDNVFSNDNWNHTVMSYTDQGEASSGTPRLVLGLQLVDIIAIQNLYGAAASTRGGDTVYGFNSTETDVFNFEEVFFDNGIRPPSISIYDTGGIDTLDMSGYSADQRISLIQETFSDIGDNTNTPETDDALINIISIARGTVIENATGGSGNDTIIGNSAGNLLVGGLGDDVIDGGDGVDYVGYTSGVIGDFTITYDEAGVATIVSAAHGTDTVSNVEFLFVGGTYTALAAAPAGPTEGDDVLNGTAADDVIDGLGGNDTINGLGGADTITGGPGDDILDGGVGTDTVSYLTAAGGVIVSLSELGAQNTFGAGLDTLTGFENLTGSAFNDILTGDALANIIAGADGDDFLNGGVGADFMGGGAGSDTYVVDNAGDVILEGAGQGNDVVYTSVDYTLAANVEIGVALGVDRTTLLNGNESANTLILSTSAAGNAVNGMGGNDTIYVNASTVVSGDGGNDVLVLQGNGNFAAGGIGDDVYIDLGTGNTVYEAADSGLDILYSYATSATLGDNVETLVLVSAEALVSGTGNDLGNSIIGNASNNILSGLGGSDLILAGAGDDFIAGGLGIDVMQGNGGLDRYYYSAVAEAGDIIQDFISGEDGFIFASSAFGVTAGTQLVAGEDFIIGNSPISALNRATFLWDQDDTALYYDADGSGAGQAVLVADLHAFANVTVNDIAFI